MSEETVVKFKIATITTAFLSIISIAVTVMGLYLANVSTTVSNNSRDIATLMESRRNTELIQQQILAKVDEIRRDQIRKQLKEPK